MKKHYITTGTVTYAIKGRDLLRKYGFAAKIERISSGSAGIGCGYNIVISGNIEKAVDLLKNAGVKILEISSL